MPAVKIDTPLPAKIVNASGYDFVNGWGTPDLPNVVANSSSQHVRIPGNMKPHSVAMHPTPPVAGGGRLAEPGERGVPGRAAGCSMHIRSAATASPGRSSCGAGAVRQKLAAGVAQGANVVTVGPIKDVSVQPGDLVSLLIGPRDGNHACDLTAVDLTLSGGGREWDLAREVSPDILAGNPHADGHRAIPASGTSTPSPRRAEADVGDPGRLAAGPMAIGGHARREATAGAVRSKPCSRRAAGGEGQPGRPVVPPARLTARTARERRSG